MTVIHAEAPGTAGPPVRTTPARSALAAGRMVLWALILRDLVVLRKHLFEFVRAR